MNQSELYKPKLKKGFLTPDIREFEISNKKIINGIFIGIFYALSFYGLLYMHREFFRLFSITEFNDILILSKEEVYFYNLFFAFIALLLAQSSVFHYWLDTPRKFFTKSYRKRTIITEQRGLIWYFLFWFGKMSLAYFSVFIASANNSKYVFSFYPDYKFVFIFIVIVLFFYSWNTFRLTFKRNSYKWFLISIIVVSVSAYGLSNINLINYKALNKKVLDNNVILKYNINIPEIDYENPIDYTPYTFNIFIANTKSQEPKILFNDKEVSLNSLFINIQYFVQNQNSFERHKIAAKLFIDQSIKYKTIKAVLDTIGACNLFNLQYGFIPKKRKYDKRYYYGKTIKSYVPWHSSFMKNNTQPKIKTPKNIITIKALNKRNYLVNNTSVTNTEILNEIKDRIINEPDYLINFHIQNELCFSDYINTLVITHKAINEIRNSFSKTRFHKDFDDLNCDDQLFIKHKFIFQVKEIIEEMHGKNN